MSFYHNIQRYLALRRADALYQRRFLRFGNTATGVHWRDEKEQRLRFKILCEPMSIHLYNNSSIQIADLGCGYGALFDYIQVQGFLGQYYGYDRNRHMIQYAKKTFPYKNVFLKVASQVQREVDYTVLSGTFNLKMDVSNAIWWEGVMEMLIHSWSQTREILAFNFLSTPSKRTPMQRLFYCDSEVMLSFCRTLTPHITVIEEKSLLDTHVILQR